MILDKIYGLLEANESMVLDVSKIDEKLRVVVIFKLASIPEKPAPKDKGDKALYSALKENLNKVRASLSRPLILEGSANEIEQSLEGLLSHGGVQEAQKTFKGMLSELEDVCDKATKTVNASKAKKGKGAKDAKDAKDAESDPKNDKQELSLFD